MSEQPNTAGERTAHSRDYLERTIATVRNHRDADNCWPSWANIFADEIERGWQERDSLAARVEELERKAGALVAARDRYCTTAQMDFYWRQLRDALAKERPDA